MTHSLFQMIRNTYDANPKHILSAYKDNAAVLDGFDTTRFEHDTRTNAYKFYKERVLTVAKVETHNHPTAVSPYPGAATGSGGEIRDEGAVGQGSKPKAGLCGFTVSDLNIPGYIQPWETIKSRPGHIASALEIMIRAPLGSAAFNNEFGRPCLTGYFRTLLVDKGSSETFGYHKPIMIAGGMGSIRPMHVEKKKIVPGSFLIVLGGPCMLIGLGGGAASSMAQGTSSIDLDFASVQRENPEMQRRCQQVIDACVALGNENPITTVHDVGAGGLSNALPELVHDSGLGAVFYLRAIPCSDPSMSPMEIWCNESQERYVLAIEPDPVKLALFKNIASRERCPYAVVGKATQEQQLVLKDDLLGNLPIDLPMSVLFGKPPRMHRQDSHVPFVPRPLTLPSVSISEMVDRVLKLPCVASKSFLITIGDRTVTGLVARDQMVGPWQVPVADASVVCLSYDDFSAQAMAMGERSPLAIADAAASARMAVGEALTNLASCDVPDLGTVRLSANWMCSAAHPGQGAALYDAVQAIGLDLCPKLGVTIPVGKDSMSMKTKWKEHETNQEKSVVSPVSVIISAFAPVPNAKRTLMPQIGSLSLPTCLVFLDLAQGKQRMGFSSLAQVYSQTGSQVPNVESPSALISFWNGMNVARDFIAAYHDRSDGGLIVTLLEMMFAGRASLEVDISALGNSPLDILFNEELGAVIEIRPYDYEMIASMFVDNGFDMKYIHRIADVSPREPGFDATISVKHSGTVIFSGKRADLQRTWSETSFRMQLLRDEQSCAKNEFDAIADLNDRGLAFNFGTSTSLDQIFHDIPSVLSTFRPKVAILREQGVNGHVEMAFAFHTSGFECIDVHMTDIIQSRVSLVDFVGIACPGGFSYGDVLGAGQGWAQSILNNETAVKEFKDFFERKDTFGLGVCNGCQMLSLLKELIPGTSGWPQFERNLSEQFEARVCSVKILPSRSILLQGMEGWTIPVAVAHGQGRVREEPRHATRGGSACLAYVDNNGTIADALNYPFNPNGSINGLTGFTSECGRFTIMMPHPERVVRRVCNTWMHPWDQPDSTYSPWMQMFYNARKWVG